MRVPVKRNGRSAVPGTRRYSFDRYAGSQLKRDIRMPQRVQGIMFKPGFLQYLVKPKTYRVRIDGLAAGLAE